MSFSLDSEIKERVKAATDIVDLIGSRLELRRQGHNYVALCPWHADRRPSLHVNPQRQIWKCWVCDIGGDVFNFVMQDEGLTFPEALKKLADRAGIPLEDAPRLGSKPARRGPDKRALGQALHWAANFYHRLLREHESAQPARDYLEQRGIGQEAIQRFCIGFAPEGWQTLIDAARQQGFSNRLLDAAGLVIARDSGGFYDRFRRRIMFPIRDRDGQTIAFGGRILPGDDSAAKYINSPETPLFRKHQQLYGFDLAHRSMRQTRVALVMEGYTDVVISHQFGIENAVAVLGTALGEAHLKTLRHYCDRVVLVLDGDEAGQRRSDEVLKLFLQAQLDVRVLTLPEGLDPADFLLRFGASALQEKMAAAVDALEFKVQRVARGFDPLVDTHRASRALEEMLELLSHVSYSGLLSNESFRMRQNQVLTRLARSFGVDEGLLRERLQTLRRRRRHRSASSDAPHLPQWKLSELTLFEQEFFELLVLAPEHASMLLERVPADLMESAPGRALLQVYEQQELNGQSLAFDDVLLAIEEPAIKSLLVGVQEQAIRKNERSRFSVGQRLQAFTHSLGERLTKSRLEQLANQLATRNLHGEDELALLQSIVKEQQVRQGLVRHQVEMAAEEVPPAKEKNSG
ncbi:MAG: hypothetical protein KatS3mg111_3416 [Pirellulaceae bacterium]|nr:MAG: hypothetical protein KatS3mg111_3416 [Pirellulaceae bacterium]